ncbi:MAG TPA: hypothetical protein VK425_00435 [Acidimicrobiales bacterium]|nr:hypothetical protein [Acidimicrobiales bacterium]
MPRARYSRWDGTQQVEDLSGDDVLRRLMDELVEHGDADQALRRLMQRGFTDGQGREVAGLRELLGRVRDRRARLARSAFADMRSALANSSPEARVRARQMLAELNEMIERHEAGEGTSDDFVRFMERYGDLVPGHPSDLAELVEAIKQQLAAARALLASLSAEQRAELAELSEALLADDDLFQLELGRLAANLGPSSFPGEEEGFALSLGLGAASVGELSDLAHLEQLLAGAPSPGALAEVDIERARELLGSDAARDLDALGNLAKKLRQAGLVEQKEGRLRLTPKGLRRIGDQALADLYSRLSLYRSGQHPVGRPGVGQERSGETKAYDWGDPFHISIERTVRNALTRSGPGTPVRLEPADFEVERTEALTRSATVIMLDLSLSMPMRGNFVAAKKMAMALHALISSRFPSDYLGIVGFSRYARAVAIRELPEVSWDYDWGTNIAHGLALSRQLLAPQRGTKQVIMVTDGEPTAHWPAGASEPVFAYPPTQETVDATLSEVARCTKDHIRVNTFALDATGHLRHFVEQMARLNGGRAFFTTPGTLGDYVLVDFLESRRLSRNRRRRPA